MKLLIVGSRNLSSFDFSGYIPADTELIISGGAVGIDGLAEEYADRHRISKLILRPQYAKYGRLAPLKRNEVMVDLCDEVLVVWDGVSGGTQYTIQYAQKKGKPIRIVERAMS